MVHHTGGNCPCTVFTWENWHILFGVVPAAYRRPGWMRLSHQKHHWYSDLHSAHLVHHYRIVLIERLLRRQCVTAMNNAGQIENYEKVTPILIFS